MNTKTKGDMVNHPSHYKLKDGLEAIDVIKATLTEEEFIGFCKGNALKYQFRAGKKDQAKTEEQEVTPEQKVPTTAKAPKGYKLNPLYVETKTKRLQLVLQLSLFNRVKKGAKQAGLSVNEYVHRILDEATKKERSKRQWEKDQAKTAEDYNKAMFYLKEIIK